MSIVKINGESQGYKASIVIADLNKRIAELEAENAQLKAKEQEVCEWVQIDNVGCDVSYLTGCKHTLTVKNMILMIIIVGFAVKKLSWLRNRMGKVSENGSKAEKNKTPKIDACKCEI